MSSASRQPTNDELYTYARWCETPAVVHLLMDKYGLTEAELRDMSLRHMEALLKTPSTPSLEELYKYCTGAMSASEERVMRAKYNMSKNDLYCKSQDFLVYIRLRVPRGRRHIVKSDHTPSDEAAAVLSVMF